MKILKDSITCLAGEGRLTLQVPMFDLGGKPKYEEVPDEWFIYLNHDRIPTTPRYGYLYLTKIGFEENKEKLKDAFLKAPHKRGTWEEFETAADNHFNKILTSIDKKINYHQKKATELKIAKKSLDLRPIPSYGDHMTTEEFVDSVKSGLFIDYDGMGKYATDKYMTELNVIPSDVNAGLINNNYTHVVWFNK